MTMTVQEYEAILSFSKERAEEYSRLSPQERELYWRMRELEERLKDN